MKIFFIASLLLLATTAMAHELVNSKSTVNVGRVVELVKLVDKADIKVNVVIVDLGGTTDVSPTQQLYFNLYSKGEMYSTDASYDLGTIFSMKKAERLDGGIYAVDVMGVDLESGMPKQQRLIIDAQNAIISMKAIQCEDFDCEASENFRAVISVEQK